MKSIFIILQLSISLSLFALSSCDNEGGDKKSGDIVPSIYLFPTTDRYTGDLKSLGTLDVRGNVDALCRTEKDTNYPNLAGTTVKGFIAISVSDEIRDLSIPANRKIYTPSGTIIASSRDDLLDGSISDTLNNLFGMTYGWWSGSTSDGSEAINSYYQNPATCSGWTTDAITGVAGKDGRTYSSSEDWIGWTGGNAQCDGTLHLMCITW